MNEQLSKRLKSFTWRLGVAVAIFSLEWITTNIGLLDLHPALVGLIALVAAEVTKALNRANHNI
ncbi:hypothetical protein E3V39_12445 [Gammaproteobacteria bacterium LSUCC0112]|nr:hypothetical protein E3V39_12445 [Gammaproteobacteria bacterium LSUCC0112]